jgi:hypothetical protein
MRRLIPSLSRLALASFLALAVVALSATDAYADRDLVTRIDFIAFSGVNPDAFCVRVRDGQSGNRLEVRQIGNPLPVVSVPVTPETEQAVFRGPQFSPWSFVTAAREGKTAPNGWLVFGQFERSAALMRVGVSNGRKQLEVGRVQARLDEVSGKYAATKLRTAWWSPDSLRVVVIINYRTSGAWSIDQDEVHGFKIGK